MYDYISTYAGMEWVSDCCLAPIQQFIAISWREQVNCQWDDDEVRFVLDQHAKLDLYSARSLKQQSAGRQIWMNGLETTYILLYIHLWRDGLETT
jgi:hypothetical protein